MDDMKAKLLAVATAGLFVVGCASMNGAAEGGVTATANNCKGMGGCRLVYNGCNGFNRCLGKPSPVMAPQMPVKGDYKGANSCKGKKAMDQDDR